jgi:putative heme utilization carrier protein HutX
VALARLERGGKKEVREQEAMRVAIDDLKDRVKAALEKSPNIMTMQLAKQLQVPEADVIRALPENRAVELDVTRWEELIRGFEAFGKVHVICTNGAVTMESNGTFEGFSTWGDFFNVQSQTLDMHIRGKNLSAAFAVEKPSHMDGVNTLSIQFFDQKGDAAMKVFLNVGGKVPADKAAAFEATRQKFKR